MATAERVLRTKRLGPLPLLNHFLAKIGIDDLFSKFVPTRDARTTLPHARALGVLLRSILVEREPIYRQAETVETFAPLAFGLSEAEVRLLSDDAIGRALDRLFSADRQSLLTASVVAATRQFEVSLKELHQDTTTVRFTGQYGRGKPRAPREHRPPWITYGHSKDHRPDLKQLLFGLTASADGGIPVHAFVEDGNTADVTTHLETWEALAKLHEGPGFLYVADSKLCVSDTMREIHSRGGRLVTVLPRSRKEDGQFRQWIQEHEIPWETVWDRPNPRRRYGPRDVWKVYRHPVPSREAWPITWVYSSLLKLHQENRRQERLARATQELERLKVKLSGPRPRWRSPAQIEERVRIVLDRLRVREYIHTRCVPVEVPRFRQEHPGRPGPETRYRKESRWRLSLEYEVDEAIIEYDEKSDGMYPLLTNDRGLSPAQVLEAHKRQPLVERRFKEKKSVFEVAPVFLKKEERVEALLYLYFLALLVEALIERELRRAMKEEGVPSLPLYGEARACPHPTAEQIFRLFTLTQGHVLISGGEVEQVFQPELTGLQRQVLKLLGVPPMAYSLH